MSHMIGKSQPLFTIEIISKFEWQKKFEMSMCTEWVHRQHSSRLCEKLTKQTFEKITLTYGGFQLGFFRFSYQSLSPGIVLGSRICFVAALRPLSIIAPKDAEPNIIAKRMAP